MNLAQQVQIRIAPQTIAWVVAVLLLCWLVWIIRDILMLFFVACLAAAALYPMVQWLTRRLISNKQIAILLVYLALFAVMGWMVLLTANVLANEGRSFIQSLPNLTDSVLQYLRGLPFLPSEDQLIDTIQAQLQAFFAISGQWLMRAFDYVLSAFNWLISLLTIVVFSFFLLSDPAYFKNIMLKLTPAQERQRVSELLTKTARKTGAYVRGKLLVMLAVGLLTGISLVLLGVQYALILGVLAFLLDIIPIIGPILAGAIAVLVALAQDMTLAIWVAVIATVIQQIENYWLTPVTLGKAVNIHPFWILLSILIGGSLFGLLGALLAVPVNVVIQQVLQEFYLGQQGDGQPEALE